MCVRRNSYKKVEKTGHLVSVPTHFLFINSIFNFFCTCHDHISKIPADSLTVKSKFNEILQSHEKNESLEINCFVKTANGQGMSDYAYRTREHIEEHIYIAWLIPGVVFGFGVFVIVFVSTVLKRGSEIKEDRYIRSVMKREEAAEKHVSTNKLIALRGGSFMNRTKNRSIVREKLRYSFERVRSMVGSVRGDRLGSGDYDEHGNLIKSRRKHGKRRMSSDISDDDSQAKNLERRASATPWPQYSDSNPVDTNIRDINYLNRNVLDRNATTFNQNSDDVFGNSDQNSYENLLGLPPVVAFQRQTSLYREVGRTKSYASGGKFTEFQDVDVRDEIRREQTKQIEASYSKSGGRFGGSKLGATVELSFEPRRKRRDFITLESQNSFRSMKSQTSLKSDRPKFTIL